MTMGPEPEYVGLFCQITLDRKRNVWRLVGYSSGPLYIQPPPEILEEMRQWQIGQLEEAFTKTGNPTYAWSALSIILRSDNLIPAWIGDYLGNVAHGIARLQRGCREERLTPPAAASGLAGVLGFVDGNHNAFAEREKQNDDVLTLNDYEDLGGGKNAAHLIAICERKSPSTVYRDLAAAREIGRTYPR